MKSCSLQLDLNKLDLLSAAPWTNGLSSHGSQYPGRWLGKRICSSWADRARPARVRRSVTWPATSLSVCSQWKHFYSSLSFHSFSYITFSFLFKFFFFFFLRWGMIIQHFSRATICDPAEGPGQFPVHMAVTDALCARTQEPEFKLPNFSCRAPCTL